MNKGIIEAVSRYDFSLLIRETGTKSGCIVIQPLRLPVKIILFPNVGHVFVPGNTFIFRHSEAGFFPIVKGIRRTYPVKTIDHQYRFCIVDWQCACKNLRGKTFSTIVQGGHFETINGTRIEIAEHDSRFLYLESFVKSAI